MKFPRNNHVIDSKYFRDDYNHSNMNYLYTETAKILENLNQLLANSG